MEELNNIELTSGAWFGDHAMQIGLPSSWEINIIGEETLPALSDEQIEKGIKNPIGSNRLHELALNKKSIAIIVDDTTRPTPASKIIPFILDELYKAGAARDNMAIIIAGGTHPPATTQSMIKKIGEQNFKSVKVIPHDSQNNLTYLGITSRGTPLYVNEYVNSSDLKIGIGCIYPHPAAGFSGGAKIIAPGVCGSETVRYFHDYLTAGIRGRDLPDTEIRLEMDEIASRIGLDFIVNTVLTQKREIAGLFAGDVNLAHRKGIRAASELYSVKREKDEDIVIMDMYPFDTSLQFAKDRGLWPLEGLSKRTSKVVIAACPEGIGDHELYPVSKPLASRIVRRLKHLQLKEFRNFSKKVCALKKGFGLKYKEIIMFSNGLKRNDLKDVFPRAKLFNDWNEVLRHLRLRHKSAHVKVSIYRCSPFLIPQ